MHLKTFITILLLTCSQILTAQNKSSFTKDQNYIFFLHNKFVEDFGPEAIHPEYGKMEYNKIITSFTKEKFVVFSPIRRKGSDIKAEAKKTALQIDSLMETGVKASHITVIGASKGGSIAMLVSGMVKYVEMNFVFIACCFPEPDPDINFCGNILTIYEKSDTFAQSCVALKERSALIVNRFKELELNTGLKHGFQFKANKEWIDPCKAWAIENSH